MLGVLTYFLKSLDLNKQYFLLLQSGTDLKSKWKKTKKGKGAKDYARFKGTVFGGIVSIIVSIVFGFLTVTYLIGMSTSDNDTINTKKIIIDFDSKTIAPEEKEKQWSKLPLMPSMDIEVSSRGSMCKFDIFKDEAILLDGECKKQKEFAPMRIDPEKLKKYVVPYIDMTDEDMTL